MKKLFLLFFALLMPVIGVTSCSSDEDDTRFVALLRTTDSFIDDLDTIYERYDALGKKSKVTSDGNYRVTPMGRLIVVKIESSKCDVTYSELENMLKSYYASRRKVNSVFKNDGGTITIDCRK